MSQQRGERSSDEADRRLRRKHLETLNVLSDQSHEVVALNNRILDLEAQLAEADNASDKVADMQIACDERVDHVRSELMHIHAGEITQIKHAHLDAFRSAETELETLRSENADLKALVSLRENELGTYKGGSANVAEATSRIERELQAKVAGLEHALAQKEQNLACAKTESASAKEKCVNLSRQIGGLEHACDASKAELVVQETNTQEMEKRVVRAMENYESSVKEVSELKHELNKLATAVKQGKESMVELQGEHDQLSTQRDDLQGQVEALTNALAQAENKLLSLKQNYPVNNNDTPRFKEFVAIKRERDELLKVIRHGGNPKPHCREQNDQKRRLPAIEARGR